MKTWTGRVDETVPRCLGSFFLESITLRTDQKRGWAATGNGLLLQLAATKDLKVLIGLSIGRR